MTPRKPSSSSQRPIASAPEKPVDATVMSGPFSDETRAELPTDVDPPSEMSIPTLPPAKDTKVGRVLGSYRLEALLGSGGMGRVYRAEHVALGRHVALKLLRPDLAENKETVRRFFQEARAVNTIGHPNIVDVTDLVQLETGETFIIMELLQGENLTQFLNHIERPISIALIRTIALQVCDALEAAHRAGVIHRDLKPDNIFVQTAPTNKDDFRIKLLDFGVAKLVGAASLTNSWSTASGSVIGTPAYMSPEQAGGMQVDQRSDIYSLGAILYEMCTGQPVFRGNSFGEFVVKHLNEKPTLPSRLPRPEIRSPKLEQVIMTCLEKKPEARFPSIAALKEELRTALEDEARHRSHPQTGRKRRNLVMLISIAAGILTLGIVAFLVAAGLFHPRSLMTTPRDPSSTTVSATTPETNSSTTNANPATAAPRDPERAHLDLRSDPNGAEVFYETRPLGVTPLKIDLPYRRGHVIELVFRKEGYLDVKERIQLSEKVLLSVALMKLPEPAVSSTTTNSDSSTPRKKPRIVTQKKSSRTPIRRTETLDPFAR